MSDCTYNSAQCDNLIATLDELYDVSRDAKVEMRVLLGTKPRHESEDQFFIKLRSQGWLEYETVEIAVRGAVGWDGKKQVVRIMMYGKNNVI